VLGRLTQAKKGADAFYEFLGEDRCKALFARRGFVVLDER